MVHVKRLVMQGFKSFAKRTEIIFDTGVNVILGPNGSGKCLTGDSLVQLADGSIERIGDLVNSRLCNSIKTEDGFISGADGTEVLCLDMDSLKVIKKPIKAFVKKTSPEKLLRIKTKSGKEIISTKYHPFFILKDGKVAAAKAGELKNGTRIAVPRLIPFEPKNEYFAELLDLIKKEDNIYVPFDEEFRTVLSSIKENLTWRQLADKIGVPYYVIKGMLDKQAVRFCHLIKILRSARLSDKEIIDLISQIRMNGVNTKFDFKNSPDFSRFFGYLLADGRLAESSQIWFTNGDREIVEDYIQLVKKLFNKKPLVREYKPNCWDVIIFSEPLKIILAKLGMASQTENKHISNLILSHSNNGEIANLLNGLYCGDGYVSNTAPAVEITTKSEMLARGIETCLLRLNMLPRKRRVIKGIKSTGFSGEYIQISLYGTEMLAQFNEHIKLIHNMKRGRILAYLDKKPNPNADLIDVGNLIKDVVGELGISIKPNRTEFPRLDSYCYGGCIPSRFGVQLLLEKLVVGNSPSTAQLRKLANSDIFWDELSEIEEVNGTDWVYDLTVEKDHNFIANNIFAHNSNVADALCFVLGRRSIKSMRAAKARNLIFMGSKFIKPAREAFVEIVFDNSDRGFAIDKSEISIRRTVRVNGQSIYKLNEDVKTSAEILETLAQAGIDPYGFNMVLQGQIQQIVRMHSEDRRKIIEEVSGIAVYEARKEKALKELEKTDEKLKEINAILRARGAFLKNLEKEKEQAEKYNELHSNVKRCKATILHKKIDEKKKEIENIVKGIVQKNGQKQKIIDKREKIEKEVEKLGLRTEEINRQIRQATGIEQETLHNQVVSLKAEIEGLKVRKENYENRKNEIERRIEQVTKSIPELENEIKELKKESPITAKKAEELRNKKQELAKIEEERRKLITIKTELNSTKERIKEKERQVAKAAAESESLLKQIEENLIKMSHRTEDECKKEIEKIKERLTEANTRIAEIEKTEIEKEKLHSISENDIKRYEEIKSKVEEIDICPLCQSKITSDHINHVFRESNEKIDTAKKNLHESSRIIVEIRTEKAKLIKEIREMRETMSKYEFELMKHRNAKEKQEQLKSIVNEEKILKSELIKLEEKRKTLEVGASDPGRIEEEYHSKILEIEEISSRTDDNIDNTILFKQRELENLDNIIKQSKRGLEEVSIDINEVSESLDGKLSQLNDKEEQEKELTERFDKLFQERDKIQKDIHEGNVEVSEVQNEVRAIEDQTNYLKIGQAKADAELEAVSIEAQDFAGVELIQGSMQALEEKLKKSQDSLMLIGSINMRALEVYKDVKGEYDFVQEKANTISKEKEEIMKIIEEVDKKKHREFMKTFKAINALFSENFAKLSTKGQAYLEIENQEDIFAGGVNIVVKLAKGKYFDVTSLSGGEQTLVALSLLFAIQEHKPYHFYIFDEIDAALDKRNSERLAALLHQYMKSGQYIVITHNDAIILNSNLLYGASMQDGVSKILSLKVNIDAEQGKAMAEIKHDN